MFYSVFKRILPIVLASGAMSAHAQFYKLHGGSVSIGVTGQFSHTLTDQEGVPGDYTIWLGNSGSGYIYNQQQYTTNTVGMLTSLQFHPKPWAGVEVNYGFAPYPERFTFMNASTGVQQEMSIPVDTHEATAAYQFHPRHIPFQPFVNFGGGAIAFVPRGPEAPDQWRLTGLVETGFDVITTRDKKAGFRVEGRSLIYRAPNFAEAAISTHSWRATIEPAVSFFYRF